MSETDDKDYIVVQRCDEAGLASLVPGSILSECSRCEQSVALAPSGQKKRDESGWLLLCTVCLGEVPPVGFQVEPVSMAKDMTARYGFEITPDDMKEFESFVNSREKPPFGLLNEFLTDSWDLFLPVLRGRNAARLIGDAVRATTSVAHSNGTRGVKKMDKAIERLFTTMIGRKPSESEMKEMSA